MKISNKPGTGSHSSFKKVLEKSTTFGLVGGGGPKNQRSNLKNYQFKKQFSNDFFSFIKMKRNYAWSHLRVSILILFEDRLSSLLKFTAWTLTEYRFPGSKPPTVVWFVPCT